MGVGRRMAVMASSIRGCTPRLRQVRTTASRRTLLAGTSVLMGLERIGGGNQRAIAAQSIVYPPGRIASVLEDAAWPDEFPLSAEDLQRYDEAPDSVFYSVPRLVTHIDDGAINALKKYYSENLPSGDVSIMDMCSSWISHYPEDFKASRVVGLGMNEEELKKNSQLTEYITLDLNDNPVLPYKDNSFDCITNAVSVDYLSKPMQVFHEMKRVLKPGGSAIMSFSNRCFPTKAINVWNKTGDEDHVFIVGSYFHYNGFAKLKAVDITPKPSMFGRSGDPMFIVTATKKEE